jgi:hypothetical protein
MNPPLRTLIMLLMRLHKDHGLSFSLPLNMLILAALACNIFPPGATPAPSESLGTIRKEISDVLQNSVMVGTSNPLNENDTLSVQNGGVGVLEFGEDLRLRLFNKSSAGEVKGTYLEGESDSPLIAQMTLFAGGFSGQLAKPGSKATFKTPGGAHIFVLGTDFFVVYNPETGVTTVGNFSGTMGVIAGGETVSLASGQYLEVPRGGTPGEQKQLRFSLIEFEDRARMLESPILALIEDMPTEVVYVTPSPTDDPFTTDTDQDGLVDGDESSPCPDPINPDTDGDGFIDGRDLDPCDASNPALTATAMGLTPVVTPATPVPPTTQPPPITITPTDTETPDFEDVMIPNIVGLSLDAAISTLNEVGLQVGRIIERQGSSQEQDTVLRQDPPAGEVVNEGSRVDLVVITQEEPLLVPDVVGWPHEEAVEANNAAGFQVQIFEQPLYLPEPGMVIDQDPPGGEPAPQGSTVNLYVSSAPEGSALLFDGVDDFVSIYESGWYYANSWFDNNTWPTSTEEPIPTQVPASAVPSIQALSVFQDESVDIQAFNLPARQEFVVTMGPLGTQGIGGIVVETVNTGSDGSQQFTFKIPDALHGAEQIAIRFESMPKGYFDIDTALTVEAWVYPSSLEGGGGHKAIVAGALSEPPFEGHGWVMSLDDADYSDWALSVCVPNCNAASSGPGGLQTDQWQHLAATYNGNEIITYRNGQEVSRQNHTGDVSDINYLLIGTWIESFSGLIDEVLLWNVSRTPSQISNDMNQRVNVEESGLVGYWRFNERDGQVVFDDSPRRNHGRLGSSAQEDQNDPRWISFSKVPR